MACKHCCMGIISTGEGATRVMRAVGVYKRAGGTGMWAGARQAPAAGAGCQRLPLGTTQASAALAVFGRWRSRQTRAGSSTCPGCRRRVALLYKRTFCCSTQCTYRLQSYCNAQKNQTALFWRHSSLIFEPNTAFWANYIIIACFPSLLPSLLLIRV